MRRVLCRTRPTGKLWRKPRESLKHGANCWVERSFGLVLLEGNPARTILNHANKIGADLIIMPSHDPNITDGNLPIFAWAWS
ncbi:universal stress protein [Roseovarius sp. A-2]|uniref:universal stress protein n=1 Tax=Roseovarius sp. A-2 TaxID=1570360 RepID=UPI0035E4122C